ncbi:MAG: hypothetical protein K2M78_02405 [Lachnospiraceae bacterium]|nr:hypothetical protein [Lachnospiraceae bacterium]
MINQRLQAIQVCKEITDEWQDRGVTQGKEEKTSTFEENRNVAKRGGRVAGIGVFLY